MSLERTAAASAVADGFSERVVHWQRSHGRSELPWQNTRDPYRVWLSEVMLQQTQVSTVLGYFDRFLARFPTVAELAAAGEDEVFGLWSGLGYYSRARNMHRCAQDVMARFGGAFPQRAEQLVTLPGIGRSTAAAIAAFCFGERVAILDGNVKRVLTRVLGFDADLSVSANERTLWNAATELLPPAAAQPGAIERYTQGLMDLGATVCLPRKPSCMLCPAHEICVARQQGTPENYPVRTRKLKRSAQSLWLLLARDSAGRSWLEKRPARGIWAGLYCLPVFDSHAALLEALPMQLRGSVRDGAPFLHVLTHKDLHLHPVLAKGDTKSAMPGTGQWFAPDAWDGLGLPAPVRKLLSA
ncbi:A/G-specific adenine glycosylase [Variovorax sp. J22G21]|uniref:A/G-specific adenine glycosylase n=1 Tax=Variovorax fucosicus TaxID=3053517 RepID=UPI002577EFE0|nr:MULTISPECIES: A/G-specific adenine glycosylase [unclassified Variovorax]MDM0039972.1 A/G-specific adenine glycosylase [Variovorax sp. J22R193]MDM0061345.1 A/G-specific adenine glycosylase [Variovorax sp. J22G21]